MVRRNFFKSACCWISALFGVRATTTITGPVTVVGTFTKTRAAQATAIQIPRTLYWVGGHDFWDDKPGMKWSLTSGGPGGEAAPRNSDNVILDQPGSRVTILPNSVLPGWKRGKPVLYVRGKDV